MKTGLLYKETLLGRKNIGDYIQSLAASQFFETIDYHIQQEYIDKFTTGGECVKVIMNGWFMSNPNNWPPSADILPLFVSFHITPGAYNKMLSHEGVEYLKKHEPIGCRDMDTMETLLKNGISAYYSSCLTLTLGLKYKENEKSGEIIFVDPYYEFHRNTNKRISLIPISKSIVTLLFNYRLVMKIAKRFFFKSLFVKRNKILYKIESILRAACFYRVYKTKFTDELLTQATYITHIQEPSPVDMSAERFEIANELVKRYAKASLVVTSRIHAALPCLGIETPVIFTTLDNPYKGKNIHSVGRFKGLSDLFRILVFEKNRLTTDDELLVKINKIGLDSCIVNKDNYNLYKKMLIEKCSAFAKRQ